LRAISGGREIAMFGEWDGEYYLPISVQWEDGKFYQIG